MHVFYRTSLYFGLFIGFFGLEGCAKNPIVSTPVGWYHGIEGGIIAQPRLPVPGEDQKYPYVGLTPTNAPPLPSLPLRQEITASLAAQRNLSEWQNSINPLPPPQIPPPPPQSNTNPASAPNAANEQSSMAFDAVGTPPTPPTDDKTGNKTDDKTAEKKPEPTKSVPPKEPVSEGPLAMPALRTRIDDQQIVIPAIPVAPPAATQFPGISVPDDANLPPLQHPAALPIAEPTGTLIRFPNGSDTPIAKQEGTVNSVAWHRAGRTIFVHGYGDATSIEPDSQARAVSLAVFRAQAIAKMLIAHNVPPSAIEIRAHAYGHGVRLRMDE